MLHLSPCNFTRAHMYTWLHLKYPHILTRGCATHHVNITRNIYVFPLIAQGDNIKIHEDGAGAPSITQWTVVPGTAQALTSWLLYTRGQTG